MERELAWHDKGESRERSKGGISQRRKHERGRQAKMRRNARKSGEQNSMRQQRSE